MEQIVIIIIGILGVFIGGYISKLKYSSAQGHTTEEINALYVSKEIYEALKKEYENKQKQILELTSNIAKAEQLNSSLLETLDQRKKEIEELHQTIKLEFKNIAGELLDEKSKKMIELNEDKIGNLLNPLRDRIKDFEKKVEETYEKESREKVSLKKELEHLVKLNLQVSDDANKLTNALKGDTKLQGNWGEMQLEMLLEKAGLQKDIHYRKQETLRDEDGNMLRPDFIINLPDDKNLIIDSKVSLTAYEAYYNCDDEETKKKYLQEHITSINKHIIELSSKNYQKLHAISQLDYVIIFVPLEPALTIALKEDIKLFEKALDRNIVLVSSTTLLATLRTISFIWKQDSQKKNVLDIARESGALYDKFVLFIDDLTTLGKKMDDAKEYYSGAMNKLVQSTKKGDTIVGRMERIKALGADSTKSINSALINRIDEGT